MLATAAWAESAAGISWTAPGGWKSESRPMRVATYTSPASGGDGEGAECAIFFFGAGQGGGIEANVQRWVGQFEASAAKPGRKQMHVNGMNVTLVTHAGAYLSGAPMSGQKVKKPGFRLSGAIVEAPEGSVFFKLTGPAATMNAAEPVFLKMISNIKKQ